jgi:hypothetical protein
MFLYKRILNLLFILVLLESCKPGTADRTPIDDFRNIKNQKLAGTIIKLESDSTLLDPRSLDVFDSLAVINDNNGTTGFVLINLRDGKLVKRFAHSGNDNKSFNINSLFISRMNPGSNKFCIYQNGEPHRVYTYSLDSLAHQKNYNPPYFYKLQSSFNYAELLVKDDSTLIGKVDFSTYDQKMYGLLNLNDGRLITSINLPRTDDPNDEPYYDEANIGWTKNVLSGSLAARPGANDFAYFSGKGSLIQIFSIDKRDNFRLIKEKLYSLPAFQIVPHGENLTTAKLTPECKYGFNNIAVTRNNIYALYNGRHTETSEIDSLSSKTVLVYNWAGEPVNRIELDRNCFQISIDPKHPNIIYGLISFKNPGLVKYVIPPGI